VPLQYGIAIAAMLGLDADPTFMMEGILRDPTFMMEDILRDPTFMMKGILRDPTFMMGGILREQLFNGLLLDCLAAAPGGSSSTNTGSSTSGTLTAHSWMLQQRGALRAAACCMTPSFTATSRLTAHSWMRRRCRCCWCSTGSCRTAASMC
jgi:hypothetical protein